MLEIAILGSWLGRLVREGTLSVIYWNGRQARFGVGAPHISIRIKDRGVVWGLLFNPDLHLGEAYTDGRLVIEQGDVAGLLALLMGNMARFRPWGLHTIVRFLRRLTRRIAQHNPARRSKAHVAHHYDLSGKLYDLFLDKDRQYSCAYFSAPGETLDDAQIGKKRHIAAKLNLDRTGLKVLDIGCGWGGLALDLARDGNADVLGITLSEEQIAVANDRAEKARLADRCKFKLVDYRALGGLYDRIVSVGMFEHVGQPYYETFFAKAYDLLADDGVMLLHTIGRTDGPGATNSWIAKYIFPGGYVPALSEIMAVVEQSGLIVTDVEVLRLHYAETCREWRRRFLAQRDEAMKLYDERFCRMWEFYLAGAEMAFRYDQQVVFQIQLVKKQTALPLTRDYMVDQERSMRFAGTEQMPDRSRAA